MAATAARTAAGVSGEFSSDVSAQGESRTVSAGAVAGFAGSVLGEGLVGLISAPPVQLATGSVDRGSGSVCLGSESSASLFVAGSDAGSADLGFVVSTALDSVSEGGMSEFPGLTAPVSAFVLGSTGKGRRSGSVSLEFPVSGSAAVAGFSVAGSAPCLVSAVSVALSSASADGVPVSAAGSVQSLSSASVSASAPVSGLVPQVVSDVEGLGFAVDGSGSAEVSKSALDADLVQLVPVGSVQVSVGEVAVSGLVSELPSISAAVGLGLDAASGLISEKSSDSAAVGLGVSVAELIGSDLMLRDTEVVSEQSLAHGKGVEIPKKSYLSAVQQKSSLSKHNLSVVSEDGVQVVQVPDDILTNVQHLWDDLIIGKFPDDSPHIAKVHVIVNKIWAYGNKLSRIDAFVVNKSTIKFRIKDPVIRDRVLRRGMWNIADKPMIVSKYGPIDEEDSAPRSMSLWVTLKQIPPSYYSWKGLSFLSSVVGEPKRLHPETELCNKFDEAKVFIEVDLTKPLPDSFSFKSRNGVVSEVKYSYPWLPPRCCACGKWGHLIDVCRTVTILKRNTQVLDPPHPVGIATDAGGGVATPLSVTVTKSGNTHPTKDLTAVPAVTKTISDTGNQPPAGFPSPPTNQLSPALSHPVCQASDVGDSGGTPLSVTREIRGENMDKEGWSLVSPKKSHHGQKVTPEVLKLGSPSRYSVLVGQEELDTPAIFDKPSAVETRAVHTENKITVATGHQQLGGKKIETIIRPSLPRQSKTARKNNSTASNLSRKGEVTKKNSN